MSLPTFPSKESVFTRDQAIDSILTSIAMEEMALSHILNAEGEKIQYAVAHIDTRECCSSFEMLMAVNNGVSEVIEQITNLQFILKGKLKLVSEIIPKQGPHPKPCPPCPKKCTAEFTAINKKCWHSGTTLAMEDTTKCHTNIKLKHKDCNYYILIPQGGNYKITLELELKNHRPCPIVIEILLQDKNMNTILSRKITGDEHKPRIDLSDSFAWEVPESHGEHFVSVKLISDKSVDVTGGRITIKQ